MQNKIVSMVGFVVALALFGCNEHPGEYHDDDLNNNQPAVNNNNGGTNTNTNVPTGTTTFKISARSSDQVAVWAQIQSGESFFGPVLTTEDCAGADPIYDFNLQRPSVFLISASSELWIDANVSVEVFTINQNPENDWSFWVFEFQLKEFYALPPFWHVERFPASMGQAEGFKYSTSAFICGMGLDMINQGCWNEFEDAFFSSRGSSRSFYFTEDEFGEIFVLGILR